MAESLTEKSNLEAWCKTNNREDLLAEWDYEVNSGLTNRFGQDISTPALIAPNSNIKVGWICNKGHHFIASPGNRTINGRGCPYCSGSKLLRGFNDFETWCEKNGRNDLLNEWDYEKNSGLTPSYILAGGGGRKYWWKGKCGHEWDAVISSRIKTRQGRTCTVKPAGCPFCSNPPKRIMVGFNDLATWCKNNHREELLIEWDYERNEIKPTEVTYGSGKHIWWKCNKNHEWKAQVSNRTEGSKTRCPICTRTQTSFPEQAIAFYLMKNYGVLQRYRIEGREVDIYIPKQRIAIEYDGAAWHAGEEKESKDKEKAQKIINAGVKLIRIREVAYSNRLVHGEGENIIEFIAKNGKYITSDFEWAIIELYKMINNVSGQSELPSIDMHRDEFSIRAHYMNVLYENSVAMVVPHLVKEWDIEKNKGVLPDSYSARNNKRVWWKCQYGHSWQASINTRGEHGLGCPFCAGQRVISGENDFETWCKANDLQLLKEWDYTRNGLQPSEIPKSYKGKMFWKCAYGHEWSATVYNRAHGTGCPICNTGNDKKRKKISLAEWCQVNNSNLVLEWNHEKNGKMTPEMVSYRSHIKAWWKCRNGHEWEAEIKSRTYNHGCPFCSSTNKRTIKGTNDLETWCKKNGKEYILREWNTEKNAELLPSIVTWGSHKRICWKCDKGHEWEAVVKERTKLRGNMCPICRKEQID